MATSARSTFLVSMVRNEADIIAAFLEVNRRLFDHIVIIDHASTDGTGEIVRRFAQHHPNIRVLGFDHAGYYQSHVSACVARYCFGAGADWVFFLDADEFLDVADKASLDALLADFPHEVMRWSWVNLIPGDPGSFTAFDTAQAFHWSGRASPFGKVALKASFARANPGFRLQMGNHVAFAGAAFEPITGVDAGRILHVPIRSLARFRLKVEQGAAGIRAKTGRHPSEGYHWFEMLDRFTSGTVSDDWIDGMISGYSERQAGATALPPREQWQAMRIPVAAAAATGADAAALAQDAALAAGARQSLRPTGDFEPYELIARIAGGRAVMSPRPFARTRRFLRRLRTGAKSGSGV